MRQEVKKTKLKVKEVINFLKEKNINKIIFNLDDLRKIKKKDIFLFSKILEIGLGIKLNKNDIFFLKDIERIKDTFIDKSIVNNKKFIFEINENSIEEVLKELNQMDFS